MATLTTKSIAVTGTDPTFVAANAGGNEVQPHHSGFLHVKNGSGASVTVTVAVPGTTKYGQAEPDVPVVVPAGGDRVIGPLGYDLADPTDGLVHVTYSAVASVTVASLVL